MSIVASSTPLSGSTLGRRPIPLAIATTLLGDWIGLAARLEATQTIKNKLMPERDRQVHNPIRILDV
ncbi:hypothetical protein [Streptomyces sp. NPDC051214]|uniref:hypothetical protein n=1 Tax=Streptomyces sp. NPDC051214 TaxID=3155282 RepID=UPI00343626B9